MQDLRPETKPQIEVIWIPHATHEFGWNILWDRPATRSETYHTTEDVCMCWFCAGSKCHYGEHYCKRFNEEGNGMFYSDHKSRWK